MRIMVDAAGFDEALFRPGDERVASLLLWHFVEEIEHRSSGLVVYNAVVPNKWYRTLVLPSVARHVLGLARLLAKGFNTHVPVEDRQVDARILDFWYGLRQSVRGLPVVGEGRAAAAWPDSYPGVPKPVRRSAVRGIALTQTPHHNPERQPLPALADLWFERYDAGEDIAHWYTAAAAR
jgi:hypothetical protein